MKKREYLVSFLAAMALLCAVVVGWTAWLNPVEATSASGAAWEWTNTLTVKTLDGVMVTYVAPVSGTATVYLVTAGHTVSNILASDGSGALETLLFLPERSITLLTGWCVRVESSAAQDYYTTLTLGDGS